MALALPVGGRIGAWLSPRLPTWNWEPRDILFPGIVLLMIGIFFSTTSFTAGIIGYQRAALVETFDATLVFFSFFVSVSSFMLWYAIFRAEKRTLHFKIVGVLLLFLIPYSTLLSGARGGLVQNLLPIVMAFWLSGRRIDMRHGAIAGTLVVGAVLFGIIYGTTFRSIKGSAESVDVSVYLDSASKTMSTIGDRGVTENLVFALDTLAQRMETASSLAVVVANYETLETYASDFGLAGNIWTFTWTAFIPRIVWPDKPIISDARAYSELYFDYGENSFAITPMGDLLRNFGPIGVPLGMALLGFVLRILYTEFGGGVDSISMEERRLLPAPCKRVVRRLLWNIIAVADATQFDSLDLWIDSKRIGPQAQDLMASIVATRARILSRYDLDHKLSPLRVVRICS